MRGQANDHSNNKEPQTSMQGVYVCVCVCVCVCLNDRELTMEKRMWKSVMCARMRLMMETSSG